MKQITKDDLILNGFCGVDFYDLCEAQIECKDCQHWVNRPAHISVNLLREVLRDLLDNYESAHEINIIHIREAFKGVLEE